MRYAILAVVLLGSIASAQPVPITNRNRRCDIRSSMRAHQACGQTLAQFEFAPLSGIGMGVACSCADVTGANGEAVVFTRSSVAYCTKSNENSNISNGDIVECAADKPRVMPGGDGSGGLGVGIWMARTNSSIRSQEFDNAAVWVPSGSGVAVPIVTANQGVAPDGTLTADRIDLPATNGATQYSILIGATQCPVAAAASSGVYAKMISGTGTIETYNAVAGSVCSINSSTWTWCKNENFTAGSVFYIGYGGSGTTPGGPAESVYIWQADCQDGATLSPPIKTAGTAVTRTIEVAYSTVAGIGDTTGSMAATYVSPGITKSEHSLMAETALAVYQRLPLMSGVSANTTFYGAVGTVVNGSVPASGSHRVAAWWTGSGSSASVSYDGSTATGSITVGTGVNRVYFGTYAGNSPVDGVIKQICADTSSTRCR